MSALGWTRGVLVVASLAMGGALAGCSQPPVPKDTFYRLTVAPPAAPLVAQPVFPGTVEVRPFAADGLLSQRSVVFTDATPEKAAPLEQYSYHFWADTPPQALQLSLTESLRKSGLFQSVVTPELRVLPEFEVQGRITRFEQHRSAASPVMVVSLELALIQRKGLKLLHFKEYHQQQPTRDNTVQAALEAAQQALETIYTDFSKDISEVKYKDAQK